MKRKSRRFQAPISGQKKVGFSLNGGLRNQGWVGQGVRGRTLVGTPFRGTTARGAGGCCGTYKKNIVNNKLQVNPGDPGYVKRSNMNTPGFIAATVNDPTPVLNADCENGACPTKWVQSLNSVTHTQGNYIVNKSGESICQMDVSNSGLKDDCGKDCNARSYFIGGKKFYSTLYSKSTSATGAMSSDEYTKTSYKFNNCLPTPPCKAPFPMDLNHTSNCDVNYLTAEEAQAAGALPLDWMNCAKGTTPASSDYTTSSLMGNINSLKSFFENLYNGSYTLCLAGEKETIAGDLFGGVAHPDLSVGDFKHLYAGQADYDSINDVNIKNMIGTVNSLCVDVIGYDAFGQNLGTHTLALIKSDEVSDLSVATYGNTYWPTTNDSQGLRVYGSTVAIQVVFQGDTSTYYLQYEDTSTALTYTSSETSATQFKRAGHNATTSNPSDYRTNSVGVGYLYWIFTTEGVGGGTYNFLRLHSDVLRCNNITNTTDLGFLWTSDLAYCNTVDTGTPYFATDWSENVNVLTTSSGNSTVITSLSPVT